MGSSKEGNREEGETFKNEFANSLKNGKIYIREIVEKWKNIFVNS